MANKNKTITFVFVLLLLIAVIILIWFIYSNFVSKYSNIICSSADVYTSSSGTFNSSACFNDCSSLCLSLGYKYKNSYSPRGAGDSSQKNQCSDWGCGCECV